MALGQICKASTSVLPPFTTELKDDQRKSFLREHRYEIGGKTSQTFELHLLDRDNFV
ncbi:uncharacterized protein METZ01_LOCUS451614 [marine metagenome]|uniref:Uncharacterized protein n=1 Tax=marine metagenome TaxID=408172 RepID=A0A382ZTZ6_9ZZZZ